MDEELFLPVLSHFENGNFWTASGGALRYKVVPDTGESPRLTAEVWEGPWRYQDSTVAVSYTHLTLPTKRIV